MIWRCTLNTLWIEKYRPKSFDDLIGQTSATTQLKSCISAQNLPHLLIIGKSGNGKSSALEIFSRTFYAESADENCTVLPVSVMFSQGHAYLETCDRFAHLYDKTKSVLANFKYIVKWHASLKPLSAPFRLIVFDGAGDLPKDAQAALRRIMERYSSTCRFIFITPSAAQLIDPIRSRCVPLYFLPIDTPLIQTHLNMILKNEGKQVSEELIEMIAMSAKGDLRRAIMYLELAACFDITNLSEFTRTESLIRAESALDAAKRNDFKSTQETLETLIISYGMSADEVLVLLRKALGSSITPACALLFAKTDMALRTGQNEYLQMNAFAAELVDILSHEPKVC